MRTIRTKIYLFSELNSAAKEVALENYRNNNLDFDFIYSDAENTVKAFCESFNVKTGLNSWLDCCTSHIDDEILNLTGLRLRKYLLNNFGSTLYKRKYLKSFFSETEPKKWHPLRSYKPTFSRNENKKGFWITYTSKMFLESCCNLTGICYDDNMLKPVYDFLELRSFDDTNFEDLLNACFDAMKETIEKEREYFQSDEYIIEQITENCLEFTKDGKEF
jgi:hypothetical protein